MSMPKIRDLFVKAYSFVTNIGNETNVAKNDSLNCIMTTNYNQNNLQGNVDIADISGSPFEKYCRKNNINGNELSEYIRGTLGPDDMMNNSEADIKQANQCLEAAYTHLAADNEMVDKNELRDLAEQYYIAINTGWSIEEFQEEQGKAFKINHSVSSAYKKFCLKKLKFGKLFAEDITTDKEFFKEYIKDSFVDIDGEAIKILKAEGNNNPSTDEIIAKKKQLQIKIFGRVLANTKLGDRPLLMKAVKELYHENRYDAVKATLSACAEPAKYNSNEKGKLDKTDAAAFYLEDHYAICDGMNSDETTQMQELGYHYATKSDCEGYSQEDINIAQAYFAEKNINPDELQAKITAGTELSLIEQQASHYLAMLSGAQLGMSGNVMMTSAERNDVLTAYNQTLSDNNFYENVTQRSFSYIEQNQETTLVTREKFVTQINVSLPENASPLTINFDVNNCNENSKKQQTVCSNTNVKISTNTVVSLSSDDAQKNEINPAKNKTTEPSHKENRFVVTTMVTNPFARTENYSANTLSKEKNTPTANNNIVTTDELVKQFGNKTNAVINILDSKIYSTDLRKKAIRMCVDATLKEQSQILSQVSFDTFVELIEQMPQEQRIEFTKRNSDLDSTRIKLVENTFIWDDKLLNEKEKVATN